MRRLIGLGDQRALPPAEVVSSGGDFAFNLTQPLSDEPVGYDPCRTIEVEVNPEGAPPNHDRLVDTGLARISAASGLTFERVGQTSARDLPSHVRRHPVLVMWAGEREVPELAGRVAGIGGSTARADDGGRLEYVTGRVVLDSDVYASFSRDEEPLAQAIMDHELGHLVGLGHVDDVGELMHDKNVGTTEFGPGDREGLARLGNAPCRF